MPKVENLKEEEQEAIEELRKRMNKTLHPDMFDDDVLFYRFLKARDFDIEKAEYMLRKHIIFRKARRIDTIVQDFEPKEAFTKYIQGTYLGEDKEGHPVRYVAAGKADIPGIFKCFTFNNYLQHWLWRLEVDSAFLKERNLKTKGNVWKFLYILDLDGLDFTNALHPLCVAYLTRMFEAYQNNYPETLHIAFLINAPKFFVILFSLLKQVLAPEVVQKIQVLGQTGWRKELLKEINADVLPSFLGGNKTDPDGNPTCETFVSHAGRIPCMYFLSEKDMMFKDKSKVQCITVQPRTSQEIYIEIRTSGSVIYWEFDVKSKNICFGLYFKESEELKEILPLFRYDILNGVEDDSYKCEWSGTYVIIFDNNYSWFNSKEVSYCITVVDPLH